MRQETLLFVVDRTQGKVLLGMKKIRFGAGKYNGMGGKVEEGETPAQAAVRELAEEVGLVAAPERTRMHGHIDFSFDKKTEWTRRVHVFVSDTWEGEPAESDEMAPEWFAFSDIPWERMWIDDIHWLPRVLGGEYIEAEFHFSNDGSKILHQDVRGRAHGA